MKLLPALLLVAAVSARAQDNPYVTSHATLMPCPSGPGVAVVAVDENGNETFAGCWGDPMPERERDDENHQRRTHKEKAE